MSQKIYSVADAARVLGVTRQFLTERLRDGSIEADYEAESGKFFSAEKIEKLQAITSHAQ